MSVAADVLEYVVLRVALEQIAKRCLEEPYSALACELGLVAQEALEVSERAANGA